MGYAAMGYMYRHFTSEAAKPNATDFEKAKRTENKGVRGS